MVHLVKTEFIDLPILIRPYRSADLEPLFTAIRESIDELSPWLPWCHANYAIEETREFLALADQWWQEQTQYIFGIFDAASGEFLGGTGLNQVDRLHQVGNLGYWVRGGVGGRGVATRAGRLVARFGFAEARLNRIEILAAVGNRASQRVAEKLGAQREGLLRRRLLLQGQSHDAVIYSLLAEDLAVSAEL
jgi:RimJ/RimL family protein N-acetyltransferase